MKIQEEYFKKSTLAVLFTETLNSNPDKKEFLLQLWANIKALNTDALTADNQCKGNCKECPIHVQCQTLDECKSLLQHYHNVQETDEYWNGLVGNTSAIISKHQDSKLAQTIVRSTLEDLSKLSMTLPGYKKYLQELDSKGA